MTTPAAPPRTGTERAWPAARLLVLLAVLLTAVAACSAPRYDPQIDALVSDAQQSANDKISGKRRGGSTWRHGALV